MFDPRADWRKLLLPSWLWLPADSATRLIPGRPRVLPRSIQRLEQESRSPAPEFTQVVWAGRAERNSLSKASGGSCDRDWPFPEATHSAVLPESREHLPHSGQVSAVVLPLHFC